MTLTIAHQELLRNALRERGARPFVTAEQRAVIRQICAEAMPGAEPEKLLIAFKTAVLRAIDDAGFGGSGVERSALLSGLVSVFIDELYGVCGDQRISGAQVETPASAPRLNLEDDSSDTRL